MSKDVSIHQSVMPKEVLNFLRADDGGFFLDCTFGGGGHTRALLDACEGNWIVAVDRDERAIKRADAWRRNYKERLEIVHGRFSNILRSIDSDLRFDGVLADLGLSTDQLKEGRGFSFNDETLDMRMDEQSGKSAHDFINNATERELHVALAQGGVGNFAKAVARRIISARPIQTSRELAALVAESGFGKQSGVHPATVVFQAIRVAVNEEFDEIKKLMECVPSVMKPGGRFAVIAFHSLEDRIVARVMREWESGGSAPAGWRGERDDRKPLGRLLTKKAVSPTEQEIAGNPSSRSALLRVFEFFS